MRKRERECDAYVLLTYSRFNEYTCVCVSDPIIFCTFFTDESESHTYSGTREENSTDGIYCSHRMLFENMYTFHEKDEREKKTSTKIITAAAAAHDRKGKKCVPNNAHMKSIQPET